MTKDQHRFTVQNLALASQEHQEDIWKLFQMYYREVSVFGHLMSNPEKGNFKKYWFSSVERIVLGLFAENSLAGFALLQELHHEDAKKYGWAQALELGAVYIEAIWRGCGGLSKLWERSVSVAECRGLPVVTKVSSTNHQAIRVAQSYGAEIDGPVRDGGKHYSMTLWRPRVSSCDM